MCGTGDGSEIINRKEAERERRLGSLGTCTYSGVGNWERNLQV